MGSCEHCWAESYAEQGVRSHIECYIDRRADAKRRGDPCTTDTLEGRKLRAGQWWDEATRTDTRFPTPSPEDATNG